MNQSDHIESIIKSLPTNPGIYQYFDKNNAILYVGKAKNLKNRVRSYFRGTQIGKTKLLVRKICDIKLIIVDSEQEALLLENSLVKKHQPPYNILLKDDKTFPWICIKNERFPRIIKVRKVIRDGSLYFGPYSNVKMVDTLMELIQKLYPLRNCTFNLSEKNITAGKFKKCLEYHIGNCKGACEGDEKEEDYNEKILEIKDILKGNINRIIQFLQQKMLVHSADLEFEKAHVIHEKIEQLQKYKASYTVVNPKLGNVDVFAIYREEGHCFVNFLRVIDGAIVQGHTVEAQVKMEENDEEILERVITEFSDRFDGLAKEILVPIPLNLPLTAVKFSVPQRADKMKLMEMSRKNAKYFAKDKASKQEPVQNNTLQILQKQLHLKELPEHIECFDNSNIQGTNPMSACVVFKNGKPAKKDYRLFNIKSVVGPDDFASMEEVVFRRYSRMLSEGIKLPQLIIIDGGKGQLSSSIKSLNKLNLMGKIAIVGIAKRLEEIYFPGDSLPLYLDKKSPALKLIQQLRNEAHRFSLKGHRNSRSKSMTQSELENIEGVGKQTIETLLKEYKSVKNISQKSEKELTEIIGLSRAKKVWSYFN